MSELVRLVECSDECLFFEVRSASRDLVHCVYFDLDNGWFCSCEDFMFRRRFCKHMGLCLEYFRGFCGVMSEDFVWRGLDG